MLDEFTLSTVWRIVFNVSHDLGHVLSRRVWARICPWHRWVAITKLINVFWKYFLKAWHANKFHSSVKLKCVMTSGTPFWHICEHAYLTMSMSFRFCYLSIRRVWNCCRFSDHSLEKTWRIFGISQFISDEPCQTERKVGEYFLQNDSLANSSRVWTIPLQYSALCEKTSRGAVYLGDVGPGVANEHNFCDPYAIRISDTYEFMECRAICFLHILVLHALSWSAFEEIWVMC